MPKRSHAYNVLVDPRTHELLGRAAAALGLARSHLVRQAIDAWLRDRVQGIPTCACGAPCAIPQARPTLKPIDLTDLDTTQPPPPEPPAPVPPGGDRFHPLRTAVGRQAE